MTGSVSKYGMRIVTRIALVTGACVLLGLVSANVFPDQTWSALNKPEALWSDTLSRMKPVPTGALRRTEEDNIDESVFQYMIESNNLRGPIYLGVEGKDPSDELMARFANLNLGVKRLSEADRFPLRGWVDPATGKHGVMLSVLSVKWSFWDRAEVRGGLQCGSLCGRGGVYEVVKSRGRWKVETYSGQWVS